jgi:predicted thioesterase
MTDLAVGHGAAGHTSVGTRVILEHRKASPVGAEVLVSAELLEVDSSRLGRVSG